jgi:hypothetical protein
MAKFSFLTNFRPDIGVAEIPVSFRGEVVSLGVLLKDGTFSYELTEPKLIDLISDLRTQVTVSETGGHYHADISEIG